MSQINEDGSVTIHLSPDKESNKLLKCPFCGTETQPLSFGRTGYGVGAWLWHFRCSSVECNAVGPTAPTVAEARERWNRRKTND